MAEEKKSEGGGGSESSGAGNNAVFEVLFWVLLLLAGIGFIGNFLNGAGINFSNFPSAADIFETIFNSVQIASVFISLAFLGGAIYFSVKVSELLYSHGGHGDADTDAHNTDVRHNEIQIVNRGPNKRWQDIESKINSFEPNDWKLAIVDADIILDEMLTKMGYEGEGIAEKLKQIDKADFHTLDNAWSAHKLRNKIAHEGSAFRLSKEEAEKAITDFKKVFQEFYFI